MLDICKDWDKNKMQPVFPTSMLITFRISISVKSSWINFLYKALIMIPSPKDSL